MDGETAGKKHSYRSGIPFSGQGRLKDILVWDHKAQAMRRRGGKEEEEEGV